jgi:cation transport regulator ChaC
MGRLDHGTLTSSMWIFGYGSLIFRPGFDFVERRPAWIAGYVRRFWQGSPDHRGTPESPGRVVTLLADANAHCGGCAYRIDPEGAGETLRLLDEREIAGFERTVVPLLDGPNGATFAEGITWIAPHGNPHFLGELPEDEIAAHVRRSHGPSGANIDYVRRLAAALRELGIEDPHVEAIVRAL